MQECRCEGTNENCMFCFGKGYLTDSDLAEMQPRGAETPPRRAEKQSRSSGARMASREKRRQRPRSAAVTNTSFLPPRTSARQALSASRPSTPLPSRSTTAVRRPCPRCGALLGPFQRHAWRCPSPKHHSKSGTGKRALVACPTCGVLVRADRLAKHQARAHGSYNQGQRSRSSNVGMKAISSSPTSTSPRPLQQPPRTGRRFLVRAGKRARQSGGQLTGANLLTRGSSSTERLLTCADCGAAILANDPHAKRCPRRGLGLPGHSLGAGNSLAGCPPKTRERMPQEEVEARLDKTFALGSLAREQGRFGSPVIHDSYDDESGA